MAAGRGVRREARGILTQRGGDVILVHVVDGARPREVARDLPRAQRMAVEQIAVVPELFRVACRPLVVAGCSPDAILDAATAHAADLIVLGAPHRTAARDSGRTVRSLIRAAACPVLVVGRPAAGRYTGIVVPVDLSDASARALHSAAALANDAHVTVVHAFEALGKPKLSAFGIPDHALLRLNVRTFKDQVRSRVLSAVKRVLSAVKRILEAEATASGSPKAPEYGVLSEYPVTRSDEAATRKTVAALERRFGADRLHEIEPAAASEDFGLFGPAYDAPVVLWVVGDIDPERYADAEKAGTLEELPANHAPDFALVTRKALDHGINWPMAVVLGMLSGIGGVMVRDGLTLQVPTVLRSEIYAFAALAGGAAVAADSALSLPPTPVAFAALALCVFLRLMALYRGWKLPVAPSRDR